MKTKKIRDERIAAETNRIYKIGYYIFTVGIAASMFLKSLAGEPFDHLEWYVFLAAQFTCLVLFARRGIYSEAPGAETFNWLRHTLAFGAVGALTGAIVAARNAARYGAQAGTLIITFFMVLACVMALGLPLAYASFAWAKRRREQQERQLED